MKICDQNTGCLEYLTQRFLDALTSERVAEQDLKVREG